MINRNRRQAAILKALTLAVAVSAGATAFAADQPTLRELATASREKASRDRDAKLREILARQKGVRLKIFLRGSRSMFVNGKSISTSDLSAIIRESGLAQATITAALDVHPARMTEVEKLIQEEGIEKIDVAKLPKDLRELATATRQKTARRQETGLREIISRQKGDHLKVYLNSRGAYVNGRSISADSLPTIIDASGLNQAILTAEPYIAPEKIAAWQELIRKAGVKTISLKTTRRSDGNDATLRLVLARQKGDQLKVYLNSRGAYINGKSISTSDLPKIVRESGLSKAILTAEPQVTSEKVAAWTELIRKAGIEGVETSVRKQD